MEVLFCFHESTAPRFHSCVYGCRSCVLCTHRWGCIEDVHGYGGGIRISYYSSGRVVKTSHYEDFRLAIWGLG